MLGRFGQKISACSLDSQKSYLHLTLPTATAEGFTTHWIKKFYIGYKKILLYKNALTFMYSKKFIYFYIKICNLFIYNLFYSNKASN